MKIKGIFHIHSRYSYDSEFDPDRIKAVLRSRGCAFGVICDHRTDFDEERYAELKEECRRLSDREVCLLPGLEFEFGPVHLLGIGLDKFFPPGDIDGCLAEIREQAGLAIWAHPCRKDLDKMSGRLDLLDGVEVWSARYGAKYAPSVGLCDLVSSARREGKELSAYAGQDAHRPDQIKALYLDLEVGVLAEAEILRELAAGRFSLIFRPFSLPADGGCRWWQRAVFPVIEKAYRILDNLIDRF